MCHEKFFLVVGVRMYSFSMRLNKSVILPEGIFVLYFNELIWSSIFNHLLFWTVCMCVCIHTHTHINHILI
jgi:hypothetical protein